MNSVRFDIKIPTQSMAYSWLMEKREAGENMSRAVRLLIETHGAMFDKVENLFMVIQALKRQIQILENEGSPDFRAQMEQDLIRHRREREAATATHTIEETESQE